MGWSAAPGFPRAANPVTIQSRAGARLRTRMVYTYSNVLGIAKTPKDSQSP